MSQRHSLPDKIERKPNTEIPNDVRTPGKDDAAEYIDNEVVKKGRWPMRLSQIAEECGWSRQHISNTVEAYFREAGESNETEARNGFETIVEIPESVSDKESYLLGVARGYSLGRQE